VLHRTSERSLLPSSAVQFVGESSERVFIVQLYSLRNRILVCYTEVLSALANGSVLSLTGNEFVKLSLPAEDNQSFDYVFVCLLFFVSSIFFFNEKIRNKF